MGKAKIIYDGLRNALTGGGTSIDPRSQNTYAVRNLSQQEIERSYRGSGLMRKIIDIPPADMVREWRAWEGIEPEQVSAIEKEEKRLRIRQKIEEVEVLRGLGGGALILGLPGAPSEPVAESARGSLAFVHVVSRWQITFDELERDATLPEYGEPKMWRIDTETGSMDIHPSRVIPFRANTAAAKASSGHMAHDSYWGDSKVMQVLDAVEDCDSARQSFAALLHKARVLRIGIPDLLSLSADAKGEKSVMSRLAIMAQAEGLHNAIVYDAGNPETGQGGEKIEDATFSFAGAKDVMNAFGEFAAAISDIPSTRLLGRAPEGMNSSGESQQKDWNKKVSSLQELSLGPNLDALDEHLVVSALGSYPDGASYIFNPLQLPDKKEKADRFKIVTEAIAKLADTGVMPDEALNRGAQSLLVEEGFMPGLGAALEEIPDEERFGLVSDPESEIDEGAA